MMETKEQKPWYHGVKWRRKALGGVSTVLCNERPRGDLGIPAYGYDEKNGYCVAYLFRFERAIAEGGGFEIRNDFVSFDHRHAELIAAAPETATERDELLAECQRLHKVAQNRERSEVKMRAKNKDLLSVQKQLVGLLEAIVADLAEGDFIREARIDALRAAILAAKASS